jgi:hypothetical protein
LRFPFLRPVLPRRSITSSAIRWRRTSPNTRERCPGVASGFIQRLLGLDACAQFHSLSIVSHASCPSLDGEIKNHIIVPSAAYICQSVEGSSFDDSVRAALFVHGDVPSSSICWWCANAASTVRQIRLRESIGINISPQCVVLRASISETATARATSLWTRPRNSIAESRRCRRSFLSNVNASHRKKGKDRIVKRGSS